MGQLGIDPSEGPALVDVVKAQRERCKTLVEMASVSRYFYKEFDAYDEKSVKKNFTTGSDEVLAQLYHAFAALEIWEGEQLHQIVIDLAERLALNMGKIAQPLRFAVCGSAVSPAIDVTLSLLGREKTLSRIKRAIDYIQR